MSEITCNDLSDQQKIALQAIAKGEVSITKDFVALRDMKRGYGS